MNKTLFKSFFMSIYKRIRMIGTGQMAQAQQLKCTALYRLGVMICLCVICFIPAQAMSKKNPEFNPFKNGPFKNGPFKNGINPFEKPIGTPPSPTLSAKDTSDSLYLQLLTSMKQAVLDYPISTIWKAFCAYRYSRNMALPVDDVMRLTLLIQAIEYISFNNNWELVKIKRNIYLSDIIHYYQTIAIGPAQLAAISWIYQQATPIQKLIWIGVLYEIQNTGLAILDHLSERLKRHIDQPLSDYLGSQTGAELAFCSPVIVLCLAFYRQHYLLRHGR